MQKVSRQEFLTAKRRSPPTALAHRAHRGPRRELSGGTLQAPLFSCSLSPWGQEGEGGLGVNIQGF